MGWNGSNSNKQGTKCSATTPSSAGRGGFNRGLFAGLAVVVGAAFSLWMLTGREEPTQVAETSHEKTLPLVRPATNRKAVVAAAGETNAAKKPEERKLSRQELIERETRKLNKPLDLTPTEKKPFRTETEKQLAKIFMTELGNRPPPPIPRIPPNERRHFAEILISDNPVLPTDSETVADAKEAVMAAKKEMQKYIKEGGDPDTFIEYYYGVLNSAYEERRLCMSELLSVMKNDPGISEAMCEEINKRLEEKGIKKLVFNDKMREKLGLEKKQ